MDYVIVNADGLLYAGFVDGKPTWRKTSREDIRMESDLADKVVEQLTQLGFADIKKRDVHEITRKWVPKSLDATKVPA